MFVSGMYTYEPSFIASIDELIAESDREQVINNLRYDASLTVLVNGDTRDALVLWDIAQQMEVCA